MSSLIRENISNHCIFCGPIVFRNSKFRNIFCIFFPYEMLEFRLKSFLPAWYTAPPRWFAAHPSGPMGANHGRERRNSGSIAGAARLGGPLADRWPGPELVNLNAGYSCRRRSP